MLASLPRHGRRAGPPLCGHKDPARLAATDQRRHRRGRRLTVVFGVARLAAGDSLAGFFALIAVGLSGVALLFLLVARLQWANAGLFLAGGRVGVIGALGGRKGVEVSRLDHLQRCTLAVSSTSPYGVLLFVDREGRALLRLNTAQLLPAEGLEELSRRSGLPVMGSWEDTYSAAEMASRFPAQSRAE